MFQQESFSMSSKMCLDSHASITGVVDIVNDLNSSIKNKCVCVCCYPQTGHKHCRCVNG